jgi:hypothetical protein
VPSVQAAVEGAGAFGVDTESAARVEHVARSFERGQSGLRVAPLDRHIAEAGEETGDEPALQPGAGEVFRLAEELDLPRGHKGDHARVQRRPMVRREDHRTLYRHLRHAVHSRPI